MVFDAKRFEELSAKVNSFSAEQIARIDPIVNLKKGVNYSDEDIRKILAKIYTDFDISTLRYDPDGPHPGSTSFIFKLKWIKNVIMALLTIITFLIIGFIIIMIK